MQVVKDSKKKIERLRAYADLIPDAVVSRLHLAKGAKYIFEHVAEALEKLEADASVDSRGAAILGLRKLGLDDFGYLMWLTSIPGFPKLSRLLPRMASEEVQRAWTGRAGVPLLRQTLDFVRTVSLDFRSMTGRPLDGARVLDFGCGYGRIARLMYYFTDERNVAGVDPWDKSIALCREAGLCDNFRLSEYLPSDLPVGGDKFDLVYAFSVFTHLSARAAQIALTTLRKYVRENGVLVITIRPIEYWQFDSHVTALEANQLERLHRSEGIAFRPHGANSRKGEATYGDTSMSPTWLERNCPGWTVQAVDRCLSDRLQTYLFCRPAV